jgi:hypothetical protein
MNLEEQQKYVLDSIKANKGMSDEDLIKKYTKKIKHFWGAPNFDLEIELMSLVGSVIRFPDIEK